MSPLECKQNLVPLQSSMECEIKRNKVGNMEVLHAKCHFDAYCRAVDFNIPSKLSASYF